MMEILLEIYNFITVDIYIFFTEAIASFIVSFTISFIEFKIWMITFAWDIAKDVLNTFDLSGKIQSAFDTVPSAERQLLYFFRMPEVITNLFAGFAGRYVLRFIS